MAYKDPEHAKAKIREHYHLNKEAYRERNKRARERMRAFVQSLKEGKPCTDCGVVYPPYVLQFDHLPGTEKLFEIADLYKTNSKAKIFEELAKCEIVCANCHAIRTHERRKQALVAQRIEQLPSKQ